MSAAPDPAAAPKRPADEARLAITRLTLESGARLEDVFRTATAAAAAVLDIDRVSVWLFDADQCRLRCENLFERSKDAHSAGGVLSVTDFPDYFDALRGRKTLPAESAQFDPRTAGLTAAYLEPLGITSILDAPVIIGGEVVGVVCCEHTGDPREWTTEDRDFAGSVADLIALKLRAAEVIDVRRQLRAQAAEVAEMHRQNGLAEMAAGVAHDFKNILTIVTGYADLVSMDPGLSKGSKDALGHVQEAARRGVSLSAELMGFARPFTEPAHAISPAAELESRMNLLRAAAGERHTVRLDVLSTAGRVMMAPEALERVLLNLVSNARDAMPDGGEVCVSVDALAEPGDDGRPGRFIVVCVADAGVGIPPDVLAKVFAPFVTTKAAGKGTGLGLAIVRRLVARVGGFVRVESEVGKGTTFRVYLPRVSSVG